MPCHPKLAVYLDEYIEAAGIADDRKEALFRTAAGKAWRLSARPMPRKEVWSMVRRRAGDAGIETPIGAMASGHRNAARDRACGAPCLPPCASHDAEEARDAGRPAAAMDRALQLADHGPLQPHGSGARLSESGGGSPRDRSHCWTPWTQTDLG